jgi:hypothetical protein
MITLMMICHSKPGHHGDKKKKQNKHACREKVQEDR